jgi:hypothetical protein
MKYLTDLILDCLSVTTDEILRRLQSIPMLTAPYKKPAYSNLVRHDF